MKLNLNLPIKLDQNYISFFANNEVEQSVRPIKRVFTSQYIIPQIQIVQSKTPNTNVIYLLHCDIKFTLRDVPQELRAPIKKMKNGGSKHECNFFLLRYFLSGFTENLEKEILIKKAVKLFIIIFLRKCFILIKNRVSYSRRYVEKLPRLEKLKFSV